MLHPHAALTVPTCRAMALAPRQIVCASLSREKLKVPVMALVSLVSLRN